MHTLLCMRVLGWHLTSPPLNLRHVALNAATPSPYGLDFRRHRTVPRSVVGNSPYDTRPARRQMKNREELKGFPSAPGVAQPTRPTYERSLHLKN